MSEHKKKPKGTPLLGKKLGETAKKISGRKKQIDEAVEGKPSGRKKIKPKKKVRKIEQGDKTGKSPKGIRKSPKKGKRELIALQAKQKARAAKMKKARKKS